MATSYKTILAFIGDSQVAGIWKNVESGYWFDCSGALLFAIYEENGNMIDCGTYDDLFESLIGYEQNYNVWIDNDTLNIDGFEGDFKLEKTLKVIPKNIPEGILREGTQSVGVSGELTQYLGEWENDTISCRLEINRGGVNIYQENGYSNYSYEITDENTFMLYEGTLVKIQSDGGLTIEGYEGVFYRSDEVKNAYVPYIGQWYNEETGQSIWLQDGGGYTYTSGESGVGASVWSVTGDNKLKIKGDRAYIDETGSIVIEGCEGVFVRQAQ